MALLIIMPDKDASALVNALNKIAPDLDIRLWPDVQDKDDIDYAIVWNHPAGELRKYPNLKVVASYGAGVDHIFKDTNLPPNIIITRLTDDSLQQQMAEYVAGVILNQRIRLTEYREYQAASIWSPRAQRAENNVCILGLGNIGQKVAQYLAALNFNVSGWSQSPKNITNVTAFHGENALHDAVIDADYIVCLLPLTPKTENILDHNFFSKVKKGAYLINVGRGQHLNEDHLLEAIYHGQIRGACLDVFTTEPLPDDHTFWKHPKITITPHCASMTDLKQATEQLYNNYVNMKNNRPLANQVNPAKGY